MRLKWGQRLDCTEPCGSSYSYPRCFEGDAGKGEGGQKKANCRMIQRSSVFPCESFNRRLE